MPVFQFVLNGENVSVEDEPYIPMLHVLREHLNLTGTKFGCGAGLCGACTIHVDGLAVRSCQVPVEAVEGLEITTIEGLATDGKLHPVQEAWIEEQVPQCGFCQSGMIMAAAALLKDNPRPTSSDVEDNMTNICRCGTYQRIKKAVITASDAMAQPASSQG
ncbi:MAG: (2Fe-2S)-binding protein [Pseudomonadota bacterium]